MVEPRAFRICAAGPRGRSASHGGRYGSFRRGHSCRGCAAGCKNCRSCNLRPRRSGDRQVRNCGLAFDAGSPYVQRQEARRIHSQAPRSRKCAACGCPACNCACRVGPAAKKEAQKLAENLVHSLLCWKCPTCKKHVEGFEDDDILLMPVGHDGSPASEVLKRQARRLIARAVGEDMQRLEDRKQEQLRARSDAAFEAWLQRKDFEAQHRASMAEEVALEDAAEPETRGMRPRPTREQCELHYKAWCQDYDEERRRLRRAIEAIDPYATEEPVHDAWGQDYNAEEW
eukprot:TRINITY_DN97600_c0_g1_i1.p1 TRINITY_DN97600_c0_g1~~TRINITY_DN97600_c0_g1_i1.p1  ORF type:complete len:286 (-),score=50.35 TRINITY_DN97600_c0_g1_i1:166-1023(-)